MDIEHIESILNLMLAKGVAAFEVGELKVNFRPDAGMEQIKSTTDTPVETMGRRATLNEELGIDDEEY